MKKIEDIACALSDLAELAELIFELNTTPEESKANSFKTVALANTMQYALNARCEEVHEIRCNVKHRMGESQ